MKYGICHLSNVPCRLEPADTSEMVSQLLYGETVKIYEEKKKDWRRAITAFDNYDCWIDIKQVTIITEEEFNAINSDFVSSELVDVVGKEGSKIVTPISFGSTLPNLKNSTINFAEEDFSFDGGYEDTSIE
ncbi:MAG: hydrolase Nlp/P60, partial [Vicingaceae bacterium]